MSRDRRNELLWAGFCVACAVGMLAFPQWQTVPFHWIWITLTFLYGFRRWTTLQTGAVLAAVILVTSVAMLRSVDRGDGSAPVGLSEREFGVLRHLMARAGRPCTREELLADVWEMDFDPQTNVVDVYVHRLREKLGPGIIQTVRNLGYVLDA